MQIFVNTKYDFVKWRFHAVAFSLIWMIVGAAMFVKHGINWGIDFAGGANIVLKFKDPVPVERLRPTIRGRTPTRASITRPSHRTSSASAPSSASSTTCSRS